LIGDLGGETKEIRLRMNQGIDHGFKDYQTFIASQ